MSEFLIDEEETPEKVEKKSAKTPRIDRQVISDKRQAIIDSLIKMFRAAQNGKNYYKKFFPECNNTGDFEALYTKTLYKLK